MNLQVIVIASERDSVVLLFKALALPALFSRFYLSLSLGALFEMAEKQTERMR